ncbi:hypothetical protein PPYR_09242 [Photinus pyralis]|uniref:Probable tRNA(His) guanylyltransferase n=1 Tax=Photinus pyralis TaxID=7054 RepID=A0A1Y1LX76_PHOPY|nr:probable tRNA(His) guanylyltransferase [Photinus pyralis]XP_031344025.1 probable tRNA(His) guanylyltransferase [Photinus pyralis]KAB0798192.1 hypothetical protein PPYR_09185 [Photinus pyralis]KAB0798249.1 hypothetical protein PPYR_09242 [Photinus pyralis]
MHLFLKRVQIPLRIGKMANSKFEYVRNFESEDRLLPNCWIIVRIDGKNFHKYSSKHNFTKPNDARALNLMNRSAFCVMKEYKDIVLSYGESDEYSFVLRKETELHNRRGTKLLTHITSLFSSSYVFHWRDYFHDQSMLYPPYFDGRIVLYPSDNNLRDYLSWRQVDTHINNLYNTTFWNLVQKGNLTNREAQERLSGTFSSDKNEILFSEFGINYNNEPIMFRKGTILLRKKIKNPHRDKLHQVVLPIFEDMMHDEFWIQHPEILSNIPNEGYNLGEGDVHELVELQFRLNKRRDKSIISITE